MNKTQMREMLVKHGISGVVSGKHLAETLGFNIRTINKEVETGKLKKLDRNSYDLENVVNWLSARPRYILKLNQKDISGNVAV